MRCWCISLSVWLILSGCNSREPGTVKVNTSRGASSGRVTYASGFTIENNEDRVVLSIKNPWQNAEQISYSYILCNSAESSSAIGGRENLIKVPVSRVVCLSTTHIGFIDDLGMTESIVGISGKDLVVSPVMRKRIEVDEIRDVGYDENINYELLLELDPDVVFAYGVTGSVTKILNKLEELNIPFVLVAEYLEQKPLAKMEWIKFFAEFYGMGTEAELHFDSVADEYNRLKGLTSRIEERPEVILGLPWRGTWYVSGGQSYVAELIADAGGNYVWKSLDYRDSRPMELEKVFEKALTADFWLNTGAARSIAEIIRTDERFKNLQAFRRNTIYNNNKLLNDTGGNAYFESGVAEPHVILADLISILHPQLLPSHELKYYQKLQ